MRTVGDLALTYLSHDALTEGVGASQVLAYVERMPARGVDVILHSFEKEPIGDDLAARVEATGITWIRHEFGRFGPSGGIGRVLRGARAIRGADLVHARADLAAASAVLGRPRRWIWDCRALFADQRLALGTLRSGSAEHRALGAIQRAASRQSDAIITLTDRVVPVLAERHGPRVAPKTTVITTCVDTQRFALTPMPPTEPLRMLLAGTINAYYDVPLMARLVEEVRRRTSVELVVASPPTTAWDDVIDSLSPVRLTRSPADMPPLVSESHVGLSVCRDDAGVSLTAAMPTKIGEFLSAGRPVIVNAGLGDAGALVQHHRCGVVVGGVRSIEDAADDLLALLADPELPARCRALAEEHFDLDRAVDRLVATYRKVAAST
jgi:glycosyltransferase involved in cell wall biosynthesis